MLEGYKTYIVAVMLMGLAVLVKLGYIDQKTAEYITIFLIGGGYAALRRSQSQNTQDMRKVFKYFEKQLKERSNG